MKGILFSKYRLECILKLSCDHNEQCVDAVRFESC